MNVFSKRTIRKQSGAALIAFLLVFVTAASFALIKGLNEVATKQHRDAQTAKALAEAKAALIGYAAGANLIPPSSCSTNVSRCPRPGDLPCPDRNNDGYADNSPPSGSLPISCGSSLGSNQARRLGRLPWRTLGLPDLRDGTGERLWYAVSNNFKMRDRTSCGSSGVPGCLNSDSRGTITVRNSNGGVLHDGSNPYNVPSGAIAIVLAPGGVLQRQDAGTAQDRSCATCNDPKNYLDIDVENGEDNADFADEISTDGFIQGDIFDASQNVIVNDKILAITHEDIMPLLERRVAGEVLACLRDYSALPGNNTRYPWAANVAWPDPPILSDARDLRFGRVPDEPFSKTKTDIGGPTSDTWLPDECKPPKLATCTVPVQCKITSRSSSKTWWLNWKEHVFYAVAEAYQPATGSPSPCGPSPNSCLTVSPPSPTSDRRAVVMVAGKKLAAVLPDIPSDQVRDDADQKGTVTNYLEGQNATPLDDIFERVPVSTTFNDVVVVAP